MTTIRPQGPATTTPNPVRDARAAFFQKVNAPAPAAAQITPVQTAPVVARTTAPAQTAQVLKPTPQPMPDHPLRPGSIIDIRV